VRSDARDQVREALKSSSVMPKPEIDSLFEDVYDKIPQHILDQRDSLKEHLRKHGENYDLSQFKDGPAWPS
jgi:hypothetical protein